MGRRTLAFLAAALGGGIELFGSIYGQGVAGQGILFGALGEATRDEGAIIGFVLATATIAAGVTLMLLRETRWAALVIAACALVGTAVAGQTFGYGALVALGGAALAAVVDRTVPLA